jgi:hypothetical protein
MAQVGKDTTQQSTEGRIKENLKAVMVDGNSHDI